MGVMDGPNLAADAQATVDGMRELAEVANLSDQLDAERETVALLYESIAQLEDDFQDRGWLRLSAVAQQEFSRSGLTNAANLARVMSVANPLIKRGLSLRTAYVWGQGVSVAARAKGDETQDVNAVVQAFWDHPLNRKALTSSQAAEELEKTGLGCNGNVLQACFTSPLTGAVELARLPFDEIMDVVCNPDNAAEHWFYLREWESDVVEAGYGGGTRVRHQRQKAFYPALDYRPRVRPRSIGDVPVYWDAPVWHVAVNRLEGWKFGIGDAYAAIQWARGYKEFLEDWARLTKALSRIAWRLSSDRSPKARQAGAAMRQVTSQEELTGESKAGATVAMGPGVTLDAIPKTGATIDSNSGRPLGAMVASAFGVPVTALLADPGVTGARATAETLDTPTELEMTLRRSLWKDELRRLLDYVIDQAVKAPRGPLKGTVGRDDFGRETVVLAGDAERTVDIVFPDLTDDAVKDKVAAVVDADSTGKMPELTVARLLLEALGVEDVDEILDDMTDDQGNFVPPQASAGQTAVDRFRQGEPPLGADPPPPGEG